MSPHCVQQGEPDTRFKGHGARFGQNRTFVRERACVTRNCTDPVMLILRGGLIEGRCASVSNGRRRVKFGARLRGGETLAVSAIAVVRRSSARTQKYRPATAPTGMAWLAVKTHSAHIAIAPFG